MSMETINDVVFSSSVDDSVPVYKTRIVYKNGYVHDYWLLDITISTDRSSIAFTTATASIRPILLGLDDISSIHQIDVRTMGDLKQRARDGQFIKETTGG